MGRWVCMAGSSFQSNPPRCSPAAKLLAGTSSSSRPERRKSSVSSARASNLCTSISTSHRVRTRNRGASQSRSTEPSADLMKNKLVTIRAGIWPDEDTQRAANRIQAVEKPLATAACGCIVMGPDSRYPTAMGRSPIALIIPAPLPTRILHRWAVCRDPSGNPPAYRRIAVRSTPQPPSLCCAA